MCLHNSDSIIMLFPFAALEVRALERVIGKHSKVLNPHHSLVMEAKQTLVGELRTICLSTEPSSVPKPVLKRKFELCEEILSVLRILEPGLSRLVGIALYEYHVALVELSRRNFDTTEIRSHDLLVMFVCPSGGLLKSKWF